MNTSPTRLPIPAGRRALVVSCLFLASLFIFTNPLTAGPITYTYDAAGRLVLVDYGGNTNLYKLYDNAGNLLQRSAPGPVMNSVSTGAQTTFAWTELAGGFTLVSTPNLRPPVTWTPVAITPTLVGNNYVATVNNPPGAVFFVLRK